MLSSDNGINGSSVAVARVVGIVSNGNASCHGKDQNGGKLVQRRKEKMQEVIFRVLIKERHLRMITKDTERDKST